MADNRDERKNSAVNYIELFNIMPGISALINTDAPKYTIKAVTDDYLTATGTTREMLLGRPYFEFFPPNPEDKDFTGEANMRKSFAKAISLKVKQHLAAQRYDVSNGDGTFSERYWALENKPVLDADGNVIYIIHTAIEITESIKAKHREQQLKNLELAQELFLQAPAAIALVKGDNLVVELANERMMNMWGKGKDVIGKPLLQEVPLLQGGSFAEQLRNVLNSNLAYHGYEMPVNFMASTLEDTRYFNFYLQPYYEGDDKKKANGVLIFSNEVTDKVTAAQKLAAKEQVLQNREKSMQQVLQKSELNLRNILEQAPVAMTLMRGPQHVVEIANTLMLKHWNRTAEEAVGRPVFEVLPEVKGRGIEERLKKVYDTGIAHSGYGVPVPLMRKGKPEIVYVSYTYEPYREADGTVTGVMSVSSEVTGEIEARQQLEESEQRARSIVDSAPLPIGVFTGSELRIAFTNKSIRDIWGKGNDINGKLLTEVLPEFTDQGIVAQLQSVYATGLPVHERNQRVDMQINGVMQPGYFNYSFTPLYDNTGKVYGVMNTGANVTDLVLAKQKVEANEANFRNLILKAPVGLCIVGGHPLATEVVNDIFLEIVGKTRTELDGKVYWDAIPEARAFYEPIMLEVLRSATTYRAEEHEIMLMRDGKLAPVYVSFVYEPVRNADGVADRIMIVALEVTDQVRVRKSIEEAVVDRTKELATANMSLQRSNAELAQFAYIASHDLQEPLRKVSTFAQMMEKSLGAIDSRSKLYLDKINSSVNRMSDLIRDVLSYSQLAKEHELLEMVDLQRVTDDIKNDFELLIEQKGATLIYEGLPTIEAIPLQMSQLFGNLISNALKFTRPEVPPVITITSTLMTEGDHYGAAIPNAGMRYYNVELRDNGIGFNQEYAEQIFNIFQRLHGRTEYSGTGIGLAMCRKIAQNHHGDIYATSSREFEAVFNVILPERQSYGSAS